ncbi:dTDP-4-dehydrorhamnose 3,5-epimerase [Mesorhizobium marinum]|uniref:dTDP-4-dehydrorhamnose 3,5-epimerase n=1 Tax=Mesorhizobium marinum TaxID=3228790 RepID=A0ABV3R106_9HYPH
MPEVRQLALPGVLEITPPRFGDHRGFFSDTYNAAALAEHGLDVAFVQDNHSCSKPAGVLRGLHYQLPPFGQDKLVRVTRGAILDVAVDIRRGSPTFGRWLSLEVSAEKWNQIFVPKGYAHGFVTLVPDTEVLYKVTARYAPTHERSIRFDDPALGIDWRLPAAGITLSEKDDRAPLLADAELFEQS